MELLVNTNQPTAYCPHCERLVAYAIVERLDPALVPLRGDKGKVMMYTPEDAPGEQVAVSCADCLHEWVIVRPRA
jgi:hypothetical protein